VRSGSQVFRYRGRKLLGIFNRPDAPQGRRLPSVLFLHGYPGSEKNVDVQRDLMAAGIASFSLHFGGAWGSEGEYRFSDLLPQARAALRFMTRRLGADPRRLAVFGFSMGGWAAVNLAAAEPGLKAAMAVAPVGGPEMMTPRTRGFIYRASAPLRVRSKESLFKDFARCVRELDPARAAARSKVPLLLVHGDADEVVPDFCSRRILESAAGPARLVLARGSSHGFLERRPWLCRQARAFLSARLKP
jgi:pimeloyl-ACP methyl ester carboxylesterase